MTIRTKASVLDDALAGFKRCLQSKNPRAAIEDATLPEEFKDIEPFLSEIRKKKPDLILTLGSTASRLVRDQLEGIPAVFCMVLNPGQSGLEAAGVALDVNPADQVSYIRNSYPKIERIGVLYSPATSSRVVAAFKEIQQHGPAKIVMVEVESLVSLDAALEQLAKQADCLIMVPDPFIYPPQVVPQLILKSLQFRLPIFAPSPALVKAGCLGGIYPDISENGCQAAGLGLRILGGEKASGMKIEWTTKIKTSVNTVIADRLGIRVSVNVLKSADEVFK